MAARIEDQLMLGEGLMVTPILREGTEERTVYLPEEKTEIRWQNGVFLMTKREKGMHRIRVPQDEVVFFLRRGKGLIVSAEPVSCTDELDLSYVLLLGEAGEEPLCYEQYLDDGRSKGGDLSNIRIVKKE